MRRVLSTAPPKWLASGRDFGFCPEVSFWTDHPSQDEVLAQSPFLHQPTEKIGHSAVPLYSLGHLGHSPLEGKRESRSRCRNQSAPRSVKKCSNSVNLTYTGSVSFALPRHPRKAVVPVFAIARFLKLANLFLREDYLTPTQACGTTPPRRNILERERHNARKGSILRKCLELGQPSIVRSGRASQRLWFVPPRIVCGRQFVRRF